MTSAPPRVLIAAVMAPPARPPGNVDPAAAAVAVATGSRVAFSPASATDPVAERGRSRD